MQYSGGCQRKSNELYQVEGDILVVGSGIVWIEILGRGGGGYMGISGHCRIKTGGEGSITEEGLVLGGLKEEAS
jgi:hypothetical protein